MPIALLLSQQHTTMSAGTKNQLSFKRESTFGTAVTPDKFIPVHFGGGMNTDPQIKMLSSVKAQLAKNYDSVQGVNKHEGDYGMDLFPGYPGYFILSALGNVSSALKGGETVVYQHTLTEAVTKPSMTVEQVIGENIRRFAGTIIHSFKLSCKIGDVAVLDVKPMGKSQAYQATPITAAYETSVRAFNWKDFVIKVGGVTLSQLIHWELEYKNDLEMVATFNNSNDPTFYCPKPSTVTGKLDFYLDATTLAELNKALSHTKTSLEIIGTQSEVTLGASSNPVFDLTLPKITYTKPDNKLQEGYNQCSL
jgi:Phage tail tube protein